MKRPVHHLDDLCQGRICQVLIKSHMPHLTGLTTASVLTSLTLLDGILKLMRCWHGTWFIGPLSNAYSKLAKEDLRVQASHHMRRRHIFTMMTSHDNNVNKAIELGLMRNPETDTIPGGKMHIPKWKIFINIIPSHYEAMRMIPRPIITHLWHTQNSTPCNLASKVVVW